MLNLIRVCKDVTTPFVENNSDNIPTRLPLDELEACCLREAQRFQRTGQSDSEFGFELCRRALVLQSEQAWSILMRVYGRLVHHWIVTHPNYNHSQEEVDYYVNRTFERLWRNVALKPHKFDKFSTLGALLSFLKLCAHSAVIDDAPKKAANRELPIADFAESLVDPCNIRLSTSFQAAFWEQVENHLRNEAERTVIIGYFYYGLKNRELAAMYPQLFQNAKQLANLRLTVLRRLARVPAFEQALRAFIEQEDSFRFGHSLIC